MAIFSICKQINDPRIDRKRVHSADAIVYIAMAAVICGAESWYEIEDFGNAKIDFFRERLPGLVSILKLFVEKTPRSHLEVKETTLA